jgi:hypothetical protein
MTNKIGKSRKKVEVFTANYPIKALALKGFTASF